MALIYFSLTILRRFPALEGIMATRLSLLRAVRQREQRRQIGTLTTPFLARLIETEKDCFLRISEAARSSQHLQIALNSIIRARHLDRKSDTKVSLEYANVLWLQREHKLAVQYLKGLNHHNHQTSQDSVDTQIQTASLLSRLVSVHKLNQHL